MWNNSTLIGAFLIGFVLLNAVLLIPGLQGIFQVAPLDVFGLLTIYGLAVCVFIVIQFLKAIRSLFRK